MNRDQEKEKKMEEILSELRRDERVQSMKTFVQHGTVSTYEHCEHVMEMSYRIDRALHLHSDLDTLLKGAMLHDFFLYDWHRNDDGTHSLHGFTHAEKARENAEKYLKTNDRINHVIRSHMWPLNPERLPRSREAWIVCVADKLVSLHETLFRRRDREQGQGTGKKDC